MRHYNILPTEQIKAVSLSKDALKRLSWIDWYYSHGKNAELACRHFGISKSVFYRWFNRFDKKNLLSLEFDTKTRRPKKVREMTTNPLILKRIYAIRKDDPEAAGGKVRRLLLFPGHPVLRAGDPAVFDFYRRWISAGVH